MPKPAARLAALPPYPIAHIPQKKRELIARGVDVIDLGAGDADLAPPPAAV
jgi:LL-diaminopimelate aminotransferase